MDESGKFCKVNVQDINVTYPVNVLIRHLPEETASGCATKYKTHPKIMEHLHWSLNLKVLPDFKYNVVGSSQAKNDGKDDQIKLLQNMSVPDIHKQAV